MEFPAISPSRTVHFPASFLGKRRLLSEKIIRRPYFRREHFHIGTSIVAFNGNISVLKACMDESDPEETVSLKLNDQKEWVHFVGIGGCGMSALAMVALKQVNPCPVFEFSNLQIKFSR